MLARCARRPRSSGALTNTPHSSTLRRSAAAIRCASLGRAAPRAALGEDHPERPGAQLDRHLGVLEVREPADLHARGHASTVAVALRGGRARRTRNGGAVADGAPRVQAAGVWRQPSSSALAFGAVAGRLPSVTVTVLCFPAAVAVGAQQPDRDRLARLLLADRRSRGLRSRRRPCRRSDLMMSPPTATWPLCVPAATCRRGCRPCRRASPSARSARARRS